MTDYDESDFDPDDSDRFIKTIGSLQNNDNILIDLVTSQGLAINDLSSKFEKYKSESKTIIEAKNKQIEELTSRILQLDLNSLVLHHSAIYMTLNVRELPITQNNSRNPN